METGNKSQVKERSLRIVFPGLYHHIVSKLEDMHIQPYDIQATLREGDAGYHIILRFGEGFSHALSQHFTVDDINQLNTGITDFIKDSAEKIKEAMIADYFKMMKM
ncbi:hypothetical protein F3157_21425 [Virgibacillus dakarensis]|uniref:Uncharacterized protein n=1 Tax=Lentibacillus populi TaxID=1827502 RepID=A0A9W5X7I0_9BACI|nr:MULTISPECIES: hypothetical protein [Bacillaceae]MBT2214902.1 hypothetical protein [Virgibacillus dakarensis]MTW88156.1 hypothetical protein [Virgibacillus dakarensis]GGB60610.1 hypothetical protein GCM10011409_42430 [Lentibacillus populi]